MAIFKIEDKFTSSDSTQYNNDSDFIQNIVLSGHTSYASLMSVADSDNISVFDALKDSCAAVLQTAVYSEFDQSNQHIMRLVNWPADSAGDPSYYNAYRDTIQLLNGNGGFRTTKYVRRMIRMGLEPDSDGNNWGA